MGTDHRRGGPGGAVLDIDLGAIVANWRLLVERHGGPAAGVLKADAYGMGAAQVARALHAAGCRHFFTAHVPEAIAIRGLIGGAMLGTLNGLPRGTEQDCAAYGIAPVLGSLDEIARWSAMARRAGRPLPASLHIDTGMNRLGLPASELAVLQQDPGRLAGITLQYVMTHFVSAERPGDPLNELQLQRFEQARAALPVTPRSLANSAAIFLGPRFRSDLARAGAALYGLNPTPDAPNPMHQPVRLRAPILQIRDIAAGESVGYNAAWSATRPSRIATVALGYADGYLRALTNRGQARLPLSPFDAARVPLVGRVSMDLTTFDVTDQPAIGPGDWLEMIGPGLTADQVGIAAGTNGYEILTSLGASAARVWHE